jgi:hypothetical protein
MDTIRVEQAHTIESHPLPGFDVALSRMRRRPAAIHLLYGHSLVYTVSLLIGSAVKQPLAVVDGAMKFNSYTLSKIAALLGLPPRTLLQRTHVTRSFTAFQTEAAVTTKLPRFLDRTPCPIVILLGLLDAYYDEQVKPAECRQSLQRIVRTLRQLTAADVHVLIADTEAVNVPPGKESLFHLLHHSADIVFRLEQNGFQHHDSTALPHEERRTASWEETMIPSLSLSIGAEKPGASSGGR